MAGSIQAGALLEPDADSAIRHFQVAQGLSAGDPAVRSARNRLIALLVAEGEKFLQARQVPEARRFATAASRINSNASALRALVDRIETAEAAPATPAPRPARPAPTVADVARTLEAVVPTTAIDVPDPVAPAAVPQSAAPEPEPEPAEPVWVPGEGVVGANQLTLVRAGEAEYPDSAWSARISGWVELEYTVARNGSVKDAKVTASEPRRIFDNAAIRAVRGNRYEPVLKDGEPVEQRARIRMRYTYKE
jgi:TonB family protein